MIIKVNIFMDNGQTKKTKIDIKDIINVIEHKNPKKAVIITAGGSFVIDKPYIEMQDIWDINKLTPKY